ncbi:FAD/NAD-P-binding domain-containing protein [Abortiporus biennis]|nr:FAD/NAD-P-binding domain-containing protein [Abortiporus biennis]
MSKKSDDRKNVVVVGGGYAGFNLAHTLSNKLDSSKYNLIMITSKPYFIHLIAGIRLTVTDEGKLEDRVLMPYDHVFCNGNGTHVVGVVESIIEEKESDLGKGEGGDDGGSVGVGGCVVLKSGEKVVYDVLVLATGSKWKGHLDFPDDDIEIREFIAQWRKRFADAKEVVLVGGGPISVETAGEIRYFYPNTKVAIVHSHEMLLNPIYPDYFRKDIEQRLRLTGTDIVFNDYVDEIPPQGQVGLKTRHGKEFPNADLVIQTNGSKPNTAFISSLDSSILTERGNVKIAPTFQVIGHPGIFAIGDIIDWEEQKQAFKAANHSRIVVGNILSYLSGQPLYKKYKGIFDAVFITIGPLGGGGWIDLFWGISFGNFIVRLVQAKNLLISGYRRRLGLPN